MKFKLLEQQGKYKYYTDGIKTIRVYEGDLPPEGFRPGKTFNANPWNKGLSKETDERVRANTEATQTTRAQKYYPAWNKGLTKEEDSRIAKYAQSLVGENNPMYGSHPIAWNKGLTKEDDDRVKKISDSNKNKAAWNKGISTTGHPQSQETRNKIKITHMSDEFKEKRYQTMKDNGTLFVKDSRAEQSYFETLKKTYKESDIIRQYFDKERYPFKCDFYIVPEDRFIEINANWTHGGKPFDPSDPECVEKLNLWKEKAKTAPYYKNAIYTWTDLDVRKLKTAQKNHLNFEAIY